MAVQFLFLIFLRVPALTPAPLPEGEGRFEKPFLIVKVGHVMKMESSAASGLVVRHLVTASLRHR